MNNTDKHTPLNWEIDTENFIVDADGAVVASFAELVEKKDNMEYIVKACNNYPRLIEALKLARKQMLKGGVTVDNADAYNTIDNAIKNAENE